MSTDNEAGHVLSLFFEFLLALQERMAAVLQDEQRASLEANARGGELNRIVQEGLQVLADSEKTTSEISDSITATTASLIDSMSEQLTVINSELEEKAEAIRKTLGSVEKIATKLSMLAINAAVEATHAGSAGAGFMLVASEVKALAKQASEEAKEASRIIDLSEISAQMTESIDLVRENSRTSRASIDEDTQRLEASIGAVSQNLDDISENLTVLFEMIATTRNGRKMVQDDVSWSQARLESAGKSFRTSPPGPATRHVQKLLSMDGAPAQGRYDRLQDIRSRGVLRVAVEPSFVGLSFRLKPGDQLRGLDAEYARNLAAYLGVKCQFIEAPWDRLTHLLQAGVKAGQPPADIVLSALPPNAEYKGVAYSETYTYLNFVLARRTGDQSVTGLDSLDGKSLGIINDPGAFVVLEEAGVRWKANEDKPGGRVRLANLIAYSDQSRIHDCLAEGVVDAFAVDRPIYHWACSNPESPWAGRIEICSGNIPENPYYYAVGVRSVPESYTLLQEVNRFIKWFAETDKRAALEREWQGEIVTHTVSFRDEPGGLAGEDALRHVWQAVNPQ